MKKHIVIMAAGLLALSACKSDDEPVVMPGTEVTPVLPVADNVTISSPEAVKLENESSIGGIVATYKNGQVITYVGAPAIKGERCVAVYRIAGTAAEVTVPPVLTVNKTDEEGNVVGSTVYRVSTIDIEHGAAAEGVTKLNLPNSIAYPVSQDFEDYATDVYAFTEGLNQMVDLEYVYMEAGTENFATVQGAVYTADLTGMVWCPKGRKGEFTIADGTQFVGAGAFNGAAELTRIVFPASMETVSSEAVMGTKKLVAVDMMAPVAPTAPEHAFGHYARQATLRIPQGTQASYILTAPTMVRPVKPNVPHNPGAEATDEENAKYQEELAAYNEKLTEYNDLMSEYTALWDAFNEYAGYTMFGTVEQVTFK